MAIVELDKIRGSIVGYPGQSGLSVEQRKRLSIGAHKPRVSIEHSTAASGVRVA